MTAHRSAYNLITWGDRMKVTVARFELYPSDDPTGYVVGFRVSASNGRSFYRDILVNFEENESRSDAEIVETAWSEMKEDIILEVERLESKSDIIGKSLILPDGLLEDEEVIVDEAEEPPIEEPEIGE